VTRINCRLVFKTHYFHGIWCCGDNALFCVSRRIISISYGMLKKGTEYRTTVVESAGETV